MPHSFWTSPSTHFSFWISYPILARKLEFAWKIPDKNLKYVLTINYCKWCFFLSQLSGPCRLCYVNRFVRKFPEIYIFFNEKLRRLKETFSDTASSMSRENGRKVSSRLGIHKAYFCRLLFEYKKKNLTLHNRDERNWCYYGEKDSRCLVV